MTSPPRARQRPNQLTSTAPALEQQPAFTRIHGVTHSYFKVTAIPGVSHCATAAEVVMQAGHRAWSTAFYGVVFEAGPQARRPAAVRPGPGHDTAPADMNRRLGHGIERRRNGVRLGAAVPAVAAGENLAGMPQMPAVEIWPERVEKHQFGIGGLPEQEVGKALLAG